MAYIVEQRKPKSPLNMVKQWHEAPGSYSESADTVDSEIIRLLEYDVYYSLAGWEYRTKEVKVRKSA